MTDIDWPWQYSFPPFFTLQPHAETRAKQIAAWKSLVLNYFKTTKQTNLDFREIHSNPLFNNTSIDRKLPVEVVTMIIEELARTGNAIPLDKSKQRWIVSWHTLEEWADIIYSWAQTNAFIGSVCTFYELTQGEDTVDQEHSMTKAPIVKKKQKSKQQQNMGVKDRLVAKKNQEKKLVQKTVGKQKFANKVTKPQPANQKAKNVKKMTKKQQLPAKKPLQKKNEELDSDEEDDSAEEDEELTKNTKQKKGVKMFKGVKAGDEEDDDEDDEDVSLEDSDDDEDIDDSDDDEDDDEDDDDDDDDDDDEEESKLDASSPGLKDLLGDSLKDESNDEDFEEGDGSDDDDDEDEDVSDEESMQNVEGEDDSDDDDDDEDEDDDEDDDEDEDEDENEANESKGSDLKTLLGTSLDDDDDDDEEFQNDEDEDESEDDEDGEDDEDNEDASLEASTPPKKSKREPKPTKKSEKPLDSPRKKLSPEEKAELDKRTVFVGNVPKDVQQKTIEKLFKKFGAIENMRIRGAVPEDPKMSFKAATITKKIHPKVQSVYAYIVFKDAESAEKAVAVNGHVLDGHTLRVDVVANKDKAHDEKKAVFIGNLPFEITEDQVRAHFTSCGNMKSVHIMKHRDTGLSRGVGYINFIEEDSVALALELNGTKLGSREIRVAIYHTPKPKERNQKRKRISGNKEQGNKKFKTSEGQAAKSEGGNKQGKMKQKRSQGGAKRNEANKSISQSPSPKKEKVKKTFQGQKAEVKKNSKGANKGDKKKKMMAKKLAAEK
ncbi:nucleolar protein 12 isoform X1 [Copidosoma floridanum]|uniref:nucleolar protein 12 isoform X1 n=2 Tax=Copidosoma floridanum TaxID=29053 RepID=UPI0006C9AB6F|nr:nucleolar protein 12 isoform X1 [Copidosoma floridanum]XP_014209083.1 nucleolar protein 12 isoform X1 [Copidosoma floridanum]